MAKNLVLLCGQNRDNLAWLEKIGAHFASSYRIHLHMYKHWADGGEIDFNRELQRLHDAYSGLKDCIVIAKSAGGILALMAYHNGTFEHAQRIIIIGMPTAWAKTKGVDCASLIAHDEPVRYIQATHDPKGSYESLVALRGRSNIQKYHSANHGYRKVKTLCGFIERFLADT